jgi:hypothetical protein
MNRVAGLVLAGLVLLLDVTPTWSQEAMCPSVGQPNVPCDFPGNCFRNCCLSSGLCPTFSCRSSLGAPDEGTICTGKCQQEVACVPFLPNCPNIRHNQVCIGTVVCLTANCDGRRAGDACLIAGQAIKVCSGE